MNASLKQVRDGFKRIIAVSRVLIILERFPVTENPITGDPVSDPSGTKTEHPIYCRITHEKSQVPDDKETPAGLSTNLGRMIMSDWQNIPVEHDAFTWEGKGWEVGPVDLVIQFGGTIGYQAPLKEAKNG
jgi:hypothetical protein